MGTCFKYPFLLSKKSVAAVYYVPLTNLIPAYYFFDPHQPYAV